MPPCGGSLTAKDKLSNPWWERLRQKCWIQNGFCMTPLPLFAISRLDNNVCCKKLDVLCAAACVTQQQGSRCSVDALHSQKKEGLQGYDSHTLDTGDTLHQLSESAYVQTF